MPGSVTYCCDRDHRGPDRPAPAGRPGGPRGGAAGAVHQQSQADRARPGELSRHASAPTRRATSRRASYVDGESDVAPGWGWASMILPQLEQPALFRRSTSALAIQAPANTTARRRSFGPISARRTSPRRGTFAVDRRRRQHGRDRGAAVLRLLRRQRRGRRGARPEQRRPGQRRLLPEQLDPDRRRSPTGRARRSSILERGLGDDRGDLGRRDRRRGGPPRARTTRARARRSRTTSPPPSSRPIATCSTPTPTPTPASTTRRASTRAGRTSSSATARSTSSRTSPPTPGPTPTARRAIPPRA